jgi:hypothetical protein
MAAKSSAGPNGFSGFEHREPLTAVAGDDNDVTGPRARKRASATRRSCVAARGWDAKGSARMCMYRTYTSPRSASPTAHSANA